MQKREREQISNLLNSLLALSLSGTLEEFVPRLGYDKQKLHGTATVAAASLCSLHSAGTGKKLSHSMSQ